MSIPVVYDTMLFLQAASRPDRTHATFRAIRERSVTLCLSARLLAEVRDVLTRAEVRAKFHALVPEAVDAFIEDIAGLASLYDVIPAVFAWPAHPDDDHVFDLAIHARARYLVTWETRILNLATTASPAAQTLRQLAPNLAIINPKAFADLIRAGLPDRERS